MLAMIEVVQQQTVTQAFHEKHIAIPERTTSWQKQLVSQQW
jgi:hypothetical protein